MIGREGGGGHPMIGRRGGGHPMIGEAGEGRGESSNHRAGGRGGGSPDDRGAISPGFMRTTFQMSPLAGVKLHHPQPLGVRTPIPFETIPMSETVPNKKLVLRKMKIENSIIMYFSKKRHIILYLFRQAALPNQRPKNDFQRFGAAALVAPQEPNLYTY